MVECWRAGETWTDIPFLLDRTAPTRSFPTAFPKTPIPKVWKHDQDYAEDVLLNIDDAALLLSLEVDEVRSTLDDHGLRVDGTLNTGEEWHDVLVTAHVTNRANRPICGVGIWIHNLQKVSAIGAGCMDGDRKAPRVCPLTHHTSSYSSGVLLLLLGACDGQEGPPHRCGVAPERQLHASCWGDATL